MNKFDKPFTYIPTYDPKKGLELFNIVSNLDTHELLQFSLVNQIPLDFTNNDGECLIHHVINIDSRKASEHAKLNVIKFLVQNKVNPDQPNKNNQTPLHLACGLQLPLIVEYLLSIGVNPNYQDNMGLTPFHYLLTGYIKNTDSSSDVLDFVPPPKKVDTRNVEQLKDFKTRLWNLINDPSFKDNMPMLETINKTVDSILTEDDDIAKRQIETKNLIVKLATQTTSADPLPEIKQTIGISKKVITDKILKLFNNLEDLKNLEIHNKEPDLSWSPFNDPTQALIKNGNTKKVIKKEMTSIRNSIVTACNKFKVNPSMNIPYFKELLLDEIIMYLKSQNALALGPGRAIAANTNYSGNYDPNSAISLNQLFDVFKSDLAVDYASDIIDFEYKKFFGGSREYEIKYPGTGSDKDIWDELVNDVLDNNKDWNDNHGRLLLLLGAPIIKPSILNQDISTLDKLCVLIDRHQGGPTQALQDMHVNGNWFAHSTHAIGAFNPHTGPTDQLITDMKMYLILAYTAITDPLKMSNLGLITEVYNICADLKVDTVLPGPNPNPFFNNQFAIKWHSIYMKGNVNIGSWIFGMWTDLMCKFSDSNLRCKIPSRLLMLIAGLENRGSDLLQSIINSYKPLILPWIKSRNGISANTTSDSVNQGAIMTSWILTLLNDNITSKFLTDITTNGKTIDSLTIDGELKNLGKLVNGLFQDPNYKPTAKSTEENMFLSYKTNSNNVVDVISAIILNLINENMTNKPLEQTVVDTIYYLQLLAGQTVTKTRLDSIDNIATHKIITRAVPVDIEYVNQQPSFYSVTNVEDNATDPTDKGKLVVSHLLGLFYEGYLMNTPTPPTNMPIRFEDGNTNKNFRLSGAATHALTGDNLSANQTPFPLNYLLLNGALTANSKYNYYTLNDGVNGFVLRLPTNETLYLTLANRIINLQTKINQLLNNPKDSVQFIINDILSGSTSSIKSLFTKLYPQLVYLSQQLSNSIEYINILSKQISKNAFWKTIDDDEKLKEKELSTFNFIELAQGLNTINSNYYLYYYLFSPDKLVRLSRFNYYQIPITKPQPYVYYEDTTATSVPLVDIVDGKKIKAITPAIPSPSDTPEPNAKSGLIKRFYVGQYSRIIQDYSKGNFNTIQVVENKSLDRLKTSKLPPSLYNSLTQFYQLVLIELIKRITKQIYSKESASVAGNETELYTKMENYVKSLGINVQNYRMMIYHIITKIVQELIKEQTNIYIQNAVTKNYQDFISKDPALVAKASSLSTTLDGVKLFETKDMTINLTNTSVTFDLSAATDKHLTNLYSLVIKPTKSDSFVLYPNDLTNINKLRIKYGVVVKDEIVESLLKHRGSPYLVNSEGNTSIYPIIKNYNYKLVSKLKNLGIDFREFNGESPIKYILNEIKNNMDKFLANYNLETKPLSQLLDNVDNYLYNDVKSMILSNESFGNNILLYLPESFHISTYIGLQFLSEHLINTNTKFTINNAIELFDLAKIKIDDINKNYLGENLDKFNIYKDINHFIAEQILKDKINEYNELKDKFDKMEQNQKKLFTDGKAPLAKKITNSTEYITTQNKLKKLQDDSISPATGEIPQLKSIIATKTYITAVSAYDNKIIERYNQIKDANGLIMYGWSQLFKTSKHSDNYNLLIVKLLENQKELINNSNLSSLEKLQLINKGMEHIALMCENYFESKKYTSENRVLKFIEDLLVYLTKLCIGNGIELMMRRILLTYFTNSMPEQKLDKVTELIGYIIEEKLSGQTKSLLELLYSDICPKLVKNSSGIFEDKSEEMGHYSQTPKEILINYFQLLENSPVKLSPEIINVFKGDVTRYFDTFIGKAILLWMVNIENIFKYFINNYRCVETLLSLH